MVAQSVSQALHLLDLWFQTMRHDFGYSGPVTHWWESCLLYSGPMIDWRYEGIVCGYLDLYRTTDKRLWLERAVAAGNDVCRAQLPDGRFWNSSFQQGPMEGGTPHEAAADAGLLELARLLREMGDESWRKYFRTAERNLQEYLLGELWNGNGFLDMPWNETLVPNKNATVIEALVLYEALSGQDMSQYLEGAARVILDAQEKDGPRVGGIVHTGTGRHRLAVSLYTARSVCGLLRLYERDPRDEWLEAASNALQFLGQLITAEGVYWGRYPDGSLIANPRLVAGAGDVLRAMAWGGVHGLAVEREVRALVGLLVQSQLPSGGIPTASGFVWRGRKHAYTGLPDFRDVLPVVGWCDKAFRALSLYCTPDESSAQGSVVLANSVVECSWQGGECIYQEDDEEIQLLPLRSKQPVYLWRKGECYPRVYSL